MSRNTWFRRFEICFSIVATVAIVVVIGSNVSPLTSYNPKVRKQTVFGHGGDFAMRMNEIEIVKQGVNPYDVWTEKVKLPPYVPFVKPVTEECYETMNAYTPWEYVYAYPLTLLPHTHAWFTYLGIMIASLIFLGFLAWRRGLAVNGAWVDGWFVAAFSIGVVTYPLWVNFGTGNYDLLIVVVLVLMAFFLESKCDVMAGICWALAMTKPQVGLLFAIPLLWRRKILTCAVAASICIGATLIASSLCHTSPFALITQASAASSHAFCGSGTMPYAIVKLFPGCRDLLIALGCVIGISICVTQTYIVRRSENWHLFLLPAFVCSTAWTYSGDYVQTLMIPMLMVIALSLLKNRKSIIVWCFVALALLVFSRAYSGYHEVVMWCSGVLKFLVYDVETHYALSSLNSTIVLLASTAFFMWYAKQGRDFSNSDSVVKRRALARGIRLCIEKPETRGQGIFFCEGDVADCCRPRL